MKKNILYFFILFSICFDACCNTDILRLSQYSENLDKYAIGDLNNIFRAIPKRLED